jgi:hypothetical protein
MAVGMPPSIGIDATVATIHGRLAEVNSEAMVLLHSRSKDIHEGIQKLQHDNEELKRHNKELREQVEDMKLQSDSMYSPGCKRSMFLSLH